MSEHKKTWSKPTLRPLPAPQDGNWAADDVLTDGQRRAIEELERKKLIR
jgi:hypothetical protein